MIAIPYIEEACKLLLLDRVMTEVVRRRSLAVEAQM